MFSFWLFSSDWFHWTPDLLFIGLQFIEDKFISSHSFPRSHYLFSTLNLIWSEIVLAWQLNLDWYSLNSIHLICIQFQQFFFRKRTVRSANCWIPNSCSGPIHSFNFSFSFSLYLRWARPLFYLIRAGSSINKFKIEKVIIAQVSN